MRTPLAIGLAAAVCATVASLPAAASAAATPTPGGPPPGGPSPGGGSPSAPSPGGTAASGPLSNADRMFLSDATQDARFEIATGRLAGDHAAATAVRSFGQRMVADHGKELQQLQTLDRDFGVSPPSGFAADQQDLLSIWTGVRGGAFDCSYAPTIYAMHTTDVHVFMAAAAHSGNAQVRQFAAAQLPVLNQHLQQARKNLAGLNCSAPPPSATPS